MAISKETRHNIPLETVARLPIYRAQLRVLSAEGVEVISSRILSSRTGVSDALLRRDLSYLGSTGRPGVGYNVKSLQDRLTQALGLDRKWAIAIVGFGSLGSALARYEGFSADNIEVKAILDIDPEKIGSTVGNLTVSSMANAVNVLQENRIDIAVVAVPAAQAQSAINTIAAAGVASVLNFAPATVVVPQEVILRQVDISTELQVLTFLKTLSEAPT